MAFRLRGDESAAAGVERIVREQIDKAIAELEDETLGPHQTVHQVRKRCKKIRGAIRLVRPQFEQTYQYENAWFRDTARTLSHLRDAEAMIETYDDLVETFAEQIERRAFASIRRALTLRRQRIGEERMDLEQRLEKFLAGLREARARVENWPLDADDFEAMAGGLKKTYGRGRKAMFAAYADPTTERFHEWRKRVKYHRYHARLLRDLWKPVMEKFYDEVKELSDLLGDDHDLAVLRRTLLEDPQAFGAERNLQVFIGLIDRRRAQLQFQARRLGERVYAEKPGQFCRRLDRYWQVWRSEAEALSGELAEASVRRS